MSKGSSSDLFEIKNYFYLGNYQAAINEASSLPTDSLSDNDKLERDVFLYRSYIAQGNYRVVLDEINESAPISLKAVKLLALFFHKPEDRDNIITTLKNLMSDGVSATSPILQIITATVLFHRQSYEEAMRCIHQSTSLECFVLLVQLFLKINRLDQAEKELKRIPKEEEDSTLTQLAIAWVFTAMGSSAADKIQEALVIYQDLSEKYGTTPILLNGLAICNLHLKKFAEAEKYLLQALEKKATDPETIVNLIVCYMHQGKAQDVINRQINQLKATSQIHPWLLNLKKAEENFELYSKSFTV